MQVKTGGISKWFGFGTKSWQNAKGIIKLAVLFFGALNNVLILTVKAHLKMGA